MHSLEIPFIHHTFSALFESALTADLNGCWITKASKKINCYGQKPGSNQCPSLNNMCIDFPYFVGDSDFACLLSGSNQRILEYEVDLLKNQGFGNLMSVLVPQR